jgi:hypothetical protein
MKSIIIVIIIGILSVGVLIPISNVSAFESEFYDEFFISYGRCEIVIDADNQMFELMLSKIVDESVKEVFCNPLENYKFEYDSTTSGEVLTKRIKYDTEDYYTFYTSGVTTMPYVLQKHWNQGDSLTKKIENVPDLKYLGLNTMEINGKSIPVHEFTGKSYIDDSGNIASVELKLQFDSMSGFLVSLDMDMSIANILLGGGSVNMVFEANDISEKPLIENIIDISSKGGGCLIATATYGSELAPQVQQLRELRDNSLLQTESGTNFMNIFNDVYYSFSPIIADYERENPVFKEIIKITLTPMISSLSILNYVDIDSEESVLGYGISLIILNGMMYVGVPLGLVIGMRKSF